VDVDIDFGVDDDTDDADDGFDAFEEDGFEFDFEDDGPVEEDDGKAFNDDDDDDVVVGCTTKFL
jgi:hypothetical protein